jgi:hypothetical protein
MPRNHSLKAIINLSFKKHHAFLKKKSRTLFW